jgi:signal transduction histidine kinase
MRPVPRYLGLAMLLAMAGFAAVGFFGIRRDVENLRVISQDNLLWSATQMEVELLRFQLSVADLGIEQTEEALEEMKERFEILWSRVFMLGSGRVGELLRTYDDGHGSIAAIASYLQELDPIVADLGIGDQATIQSILDRLREFQKELRLYTLRVVRADTAASALVRDRIQSSAQTTAVISLAAVLISVLSLFLILRESRRQQEIAGINLRIAAEAEQSSRAKSRFLAMMSHELRNPLNGILGPLALLGQSEIAGRHKRLVAQAQHSGQAMLQMLAGLLDYGEMQDGRLHLKIEPFRVSALADGVRSALESAGAEGVEVRVQPGTPERLHGDADRLRQIFVHLTEYVLEGRQSGGVEVVFGYDGGALVGEICCVVVGTEMDWRLDLLMGLSEIAPDQVSADALRPLIARGLISVNRGVLTLADNAQGRRAIRVSVPCESVRMEHINVHLETRSSALAAIYKAALRSDRVIFAGPDGPKPVDVVLVDSTSVGEDPLMARLRARFPEALFVSLGLPQSPDFFDDIVEAPTDMGRLRKSILGRLAS